MDGFFFVFSIFCINEIVFIEWGPRAYIETSKPNLYSHAFYLVHNDYPPPDEHGIHKLKRDHKEEKQFLFGNGKNMNNSVARNNNSNNRNRRANYDGEEETSSDYDEEVPIRSQRRRY